MNNYKKDYSDFRRFVNLEINEDEFSEFKKRKITEEEICEIVRRADINPANEVERIKKIWNEKEKEIVAEINKLTGLKINPKNILCCIDPYQKGGYYGEDNITVGTYKNPEDVLFVIAHELFHIFYWRKIKELGITESVLGKEEIWEWELAEVTVHLLQTESSIRKFWQTINIEMSPQFEEICKIVKDIWKKNSFSEFLTKSYSVLRNGKQ